MKRVSMRMLAVLAAFVLLVATLPMAALADETPRVLALDTPQTVEVSGDNSALFTFTASEAGMYLFCSQLKGNGDPYVNLLDEFGDSIDFADDYGGTLNFRLVVELAAGETCTLRVSAYASEPLPVPVVMMKAADPTGVEIYRGKDAVTLALMEAGRVDVEVSPENAVTSDIVFEAEDPSIIDIDENGFFWAAGIGTTTVTVTANGTVTDTVTLTVSEPTPWGDVSKRDVILTRDRTARTYSFTPEEDGWYEFFSEGDACPWAELFVQEEDGIYNMGVADMLDNWNFTLTSLLEAGQTYYLLVYAQDIMGATTFSVSVREGEEPNVVEEGVGFLNDRITVSVGDVFLPAYWVGYDEYVASLTAADDTIVSTSGVDRVTALKEGETTLTIATGDGATDTIEVEVVATPTLALGEKTEVGFEDIIERCYVLRPEKTGTYMLRSFSKNDDDPYVSLYDDEWNELGGQDDSAEDLQFNMACELTAGETYYVLIGGYITEPCEVLFDEAAVATDVSLTLWDETYVKVEGDTYYVYAEGNTWPKVAFGPAANTVEEDFELESANEEIVAIDGWDIIFLAPGQTTVTVTTENGLTDTITIVVIDYVVGDVTLDGKLTKEDLAALQAYLLNPAALGDLWYLADYNQDGVVDAADAEAMEAEVGPAGALADVDGDNEITSTDARLVLQYVAGKIEADDLNLAVVDVDGDNEATSTDARLILQKVAGKIPAFPAE